MRLEDVLGIALVDAVAAAVGVVAAAVVADAKERVAVADPHAAVPAHPARHPLKRPSKSEVNRYVDA